MESGKSLRHASRPIDARAGWTLIEIVISTVILLTVVMGFSYGLASSTSLGQATREQGLAREAARARIELLRGTAFEDVLASFDGADAHFDVLGLSAQPEDPDGRVGEIVFPLDENGLLLEGLDMPRLGMPRDLTGEGDMDNLDHSGDYRILPVLVRLSWRGAGGDGSFELLTILKKMRP